MKIFLTSVALIISVAFVFEAYSLTKGTTGQTMLSENSYAIGDDLTFDCGRSVFSTIHGVVNSIGPVIFKEQTNTYYFRDKKTRRFRRIPAVCTVHYPHNKDSIAVVRRNEKKEEEARDRQEKERVRQEDWKAEETIKLNQERGVGNWDNGELNERLLSREFRVFLQKGESRGESK